MTKQSQTFPRGNYKLIALDMDGTTLGDDGEISEVNRKWLLEAMREGVKVVFATGRGMVRITRFMEALGMTGPVITTNGGEVWRNPGLLHSRRTLDLDVVNEICRMAIEEDLDFWAYTAEGLFKRNAWIIEEQISQYAWLKFGFRIHDQAQMVRLRQQLSTWDRIEVTSSMPHQIEVNASGVNKGNAVCQVCSMLDIDMSDVVAIGDGENDISMITAAGLGVAMGNATDEVKQCADLITATNEQHGVAQIIQQYIM